MAEPDCDKHESDEARWSALMVSAQAGNEDEYRLLLQELSEAIRRYLLSRIGPHHYLEDCVQETLIAIHQARHTYDRRRRFRPWMFAIVRHKAIDALRCQRSHQQLLRRQQDEVLVNCRQDQPGKPEDAVAQGQMMTCLRPQYREALTLTKIIGLSNAEAAARLCISEGAVKVRVHRAIGRLRRLLEADAL
jgi:RNA polymerase sigma factor (sigma-70 family)